MKNRPEGTFDGTELSVRCHLCGDSQKHRDQCHASINIISGLYYCYRCQSGFKMSNYDLGFWAKGLNFDKAHLVKTELNKDMDSLILAIEEKLRPGPGIQRYSALDRFHIKTAKGTKLDVFKIMDASQEVYGYHIRHPTDKGQSRTYGKRLLGMSSKIRHNRIWRVVEGPYDALDPHSDVVCFGFPSETQSKSLYGKELILCPDGDVWDDWRKLRQFMKSFIWDNNHRIAYIERLPRGKDPDEVMPRDREQLSLEELRAMLTPKKTFFVNRMTIEQIRDDINANIPEDQFWAEYTENQGV